MAVGFSNDRSMVSCLIGPAACHTHGLGELLINIYTGSLRPKLKPLNTLLYSTFDRKDTPFLYLVYNYVSLLTT